MATYAYGDCCCPTLYGEAFVAAYVSSSEFSIERMALSQHLNYSQSALQSDWSVSVTSMKDTSDSDVPVTLTNGFISLTASPTGDTLWFDSAEFFGIVDISTIGSPSLTGVYERDNGAGGTAQYPVSQPRNYPGAYQLRSYFFLDGGIAARTCWGDDWFVYVEMQGGVAGGPWYEPRIFFADPTDHVFRDDAYFDFSSTDFIPLGLCRSGWPAKAIVMKKEVTLDGGGETDYVVMRIGYITLPSTCPTSYPETLSSPTFTEVFSRTYTNGTGNSTGTDACDVLPGRAIVSDFDVVGSDAVWAIFAADDDTTTANNYLTDYTWKWTYSDSIDSETSRTVSQSAFFTIFNTQPAYDIGNSVVEIHVCDSGIFGIKGDGSAWLDDTELAADFRDPVDTDLHSGYEGLDEFPGSLHRMGTRARFVATADSEGDAKDEERLYYITQYDDDVNASERDLASDWGWSTSVFGTGSYHVAQISISNLGAPSSYLIPGYRVTDGGSTVTEVAPESLTSGDGICEVSTDSADPYIPTDEHTRRGY